MTNARGEPWIEVIVADSTIPLLGGGFVDEPTDLALMLGLSEAWREAEVITPAGADPLTLTRLRDGIDVRWAGPLAARIRW